MAQSDTKFKQDLNALVGDDEAEKVLYQARLRWPSLRVYRELEITPETAASNGEIFDTSQKLRMNQQSQQDTHS